MLPRILGMMCFAIWISCGVAQAALPAITKNNISPVYGKWEWANGFNAPPLIITKLSIFDGQCRWRYQVESVYRKPARFGGQLLVLELKLDHPSPKSICGRHSEEYLELDFADTGASARHPKALEAFWCPSKKELDKLRRSPGTALCARGIASPPFSKSQK